ncbi:hypothetical protein D3C85_1691420 [compost metagenome]
MSYFWQQMGIWSMSLRERFILYFGARFILLLKIRAALPSGLDIPRSQVSLHGNTRNFSGRICWIAPFHSL